MPASPWTSFAAPENGGEYVALLSYLPLNKWRTMPKFMRYVLPDLASASRFGGSASGTGTSLLGTIPAVPCTIT